MIHGIKFFLIYHVKVFSPCDLGLLPFGVKI